MKTRVQVALMGCLASIAAHLYLTLHYYPLKFGFSAEQSMCNLNAKFNCDAVAASSYSAFLGVPLSIWGLITNAVLFFLILFSWLEWTEHPERMKRWTVLLAGGSLLASLVMGAISLTQLSSYCLFCLSLYVLSGLIFWAILGFIKEPFWTNLKHDLPELLTASRGVLIAFVAIPVLAFVTHQIFLQNLGAPQVDKIVQDALDAWQASPKQNFVAKPTLVMGPAADHAAMTLVEFADFRCSHCKHASYSLDAFVKSHPDVRFEFYTFPLDGACNEKIQGSNGMSCRLAAAVYCADKDNKGWELHDQLFNIQEEVNQLNSVKDLDQLLSSTVSQLGLNWETLKTCMADPASEDAVKAQAKQGGLVDVRGTPTMFVNGKQLEGAQMVPVLEAVRRVSKASL